MSGFPSSLAFLLPALAFLLTVAAMPEGIRRLRLLHFGQNVREDGPQTHMGKQGTPTMGGAVFVPIAVALGFLADSVRPIGASGRAGLLALFTLAGFGIGFLDDYLSIKRGKSLGLKAREKFALQFLLAALFLWFSGVTKIPVGRPAGGFGGAEIALVARFVFYMLVVVWLVNAANLADGLDGLVASQSMVSIASIMLVGIFFGHMAPGAFSFFPLAFVGALAGFLCFNAPPAKVFMGDAGSIALGCFVTAYGLLYVPLWAVVLATAVWSLEALSVVIQVTYFKLTGGQRIFRMSPLHHHFELCGWPETQVTARFIAASLFFGILVPFALLGVMMP